MSRHHQAAGWGGRRVVELRALWRTVLPVPCSRCGRPVEPWHRFDLDHPAGIAVDAETTWPAHLLCNRGRHPVADKPPPVEARPSRTWA